MNEFRMRSIRVYLFLTVFTMMCFHSKTMYAQIDCTNGVLEPTEANLEEYEIQPWYSKEAGIKAALASIMTKTYYDEILLEVRPADTNSDTEKKDKQKRSYSGSAETEIILGLTDFIIDRAKAETIQWYTQDMQTHVCDGKYHEYFYNACIMKSQSSETLPYLPGLIQAFKKDLELMPAGLLCKNFKTDQGFYLKSLTKKIISGVTAENMVAGLAQNKQIVSGCSTSTISQRGNTCVLYTTGLAAQAYIELVDAKDWGKALSVLDSKITGTLLFGVYPDETVKKQYILEMATLFKDVEIQVKKIKRAKKEGNQQAISASAAIRISEDIIAIIYNPYTRALKGNTAGNKTVIQPVINAFASVVAGQFSDALLDINIIVNQYYDSMLKELMDELEVGIIYAVAEAGDVQFTAAEFNKTTEMKTTCDYLYSKYYPEVAKKCMSEQDLNDLLRRDNVAQRLIDKKYSDKIDGLFIMMDALGKKENEQRGNWQGFAKLRDKVRLILNRLILEETVPSLPKSTFCYADLLVAYATLYNPDTAGSLNELKYLPMEEKAAKIIKLLKLPEPNIIERLSLSQQCKERYVALSQLVYKKYSENGINMISSDNPVQKYLPVVASLATAKSQEEVKNVLNETAASVGSWRLKQRKKYTGSFGAMLGLDVGYENLSKSENNGWAGGIFAPIGMDFTTNNPICLGSTCGLFVSVLDLGAVASMRFNDKSQVESKTGNIHLSQVMSPGLYFRSSIKKTPLVWGLGWSYVPLLRIEEVNGEKVDKGGSRVLLFMTVDLPMFFF